MGNSVKIVLAVEGAKEASLAELSWTALYERLSVIRALPDNTLTRELRRLERNREIERIQDGREVRYKLKLEIFPDRIPELAREYVGEAIRGAIGVGMDSRLLTENWSIYGVPKETLPRFRRSIRKSLERLQDAIDRFLYSEVEAISGWLRTRPELRERGAEIRAARDSLRFLIDESTEVRSVFEAGPLGLKLVGLDPSQIPEPLVADVTASLIKRAQAEPNPFAAAVQSVAAVIEALKPHNRKLAFAKLNRLLSTTRWATVVVR